MSFKTYLFDFDGTLVDSMPAYILAMLRILDENNVEYERDIIKIITPLGYLGTAKYYREKFGIEMGEEKIVETMKKYAYDKYAYSIPAKENVFKTLKSLKEKGARLNILTASPHEVLDVCLGRLGIDGLFENIWSCDDFGTTKADVNIYKMAADKMGDVISEILFLDDNYNACKTAKLSGMKVCGVFDDSSSNFTDEIKAVSDYYINDFSELLDI